MAGRAQHANGGSGRRTRGATDRGAVSRRRSLCLVVVLAVVATVAAVSSIDVGAVALVAPPAVGQFGSAGSGPDQFLNPRGIAANWKGDLYVADCGNNRIQHLSSTGTFIGRFGTSGSGNGQFQCPVDVAFAGDGTLLVVDQGNRRVQQFQVNGAFIRAWPTGTSSAGLPWAVDVDGQGRVYVTDAEPETHEQVCTIDIGGYECHDVTHPPSPDNNKVRRFTADGTFLDQWGSYGARYDLRGLWITGAGRLHLINRLRVEVDTLDGTVLATYPSGGSDYTASDVAVDPLGNIWVAGGNKVRELGPDGSLLVTYDLPGAFGITVDQDHVYVTNGNRVTRLGPGTPLTAIVGTVTDDWTGVTVAGTYVVALQASDLQFVRGATADAVGRYRLDVPAGQYVLQFFDPTGRYGAEWYRDHPAPADPAHVEHVTAVAGTEVSADAALGYQLGGIQVQLAGNTPSGVVVGGYVVALRNGTPAGIGTANVGGLAAIAGLRPGTYTVAALDPEGQAVPEFYDNATNPSAATPVTVPAGGNAVRFINLAPATPAPTTGAVTGTITEDGTGQPVSGALIVALRASDLSFVRATRTAADGTYSLSVPAGAHYLQIASPTGRHQFEWYDDQPNPASFATLTTVSAGTVANASVHPLTGTIAGTVTETGSSDPLGGGWVVVYGPGGSFGTQTAADGTYTMADLAPGTYSVVFVDPSGDHRFEYYDDQPGPAGATPVPVQAAATATVDATLDPS